jgi:hypothetical protein
MTLKDKEGGKRWMNMFRNFPGDILQQCVDDFSKQTGVRIEMNEREISYKW